MVNMRSLRNAGVRSLTLLEEASAQNPVLRHKSGGEQYPQASTSS